MTTEHLATMMNGVLRKEAGPAADAARLAHAFATLCDRLRHRLEPLVGVNGVRALFGRGLYLAKPDFPWLTSTQLITAPGCALQHVVEAAHDVDVLLIAEGLAAILGHDLSVLFQFIGEDLALPLVETAWPEAVRFRNPAGTIAHD